MLHAVAPDDAAWRTIVMQMSDHLTKGFSVDDFAKALGQEKEITGYIYHSVPVALFAWHRHFVSWIQETASAILKEDEDHFLLFSKPDQIRADLAAWLNDGDGKRGVLTE